MQPFQNAEQVIWKYNQAIAHNSLTQNGWQRILSQSDDSLQFYLNSIKGSTASVAGYTVSLQGNVTGLKNVSQAIKQYNALSIKGQKEQNAFSNAVSITNGKFGSYLSGLNGAKASLKGYTASLITSTASTIGLTIATTALNMALTMGVSFIITGVISAISSWINKSDELIEKFKETKEKITSLKNELQTNTETVETVKKRYAELSQEVEHLGKISQAKGTLNNEEYEEFLDLSNQLAAIFPSLIVGYDENGNAILNLSGNVDTIVTSLDNLINKEKELANQKIMKEMPDLFAGYSESIKRAEKKIKSAQTSFDKINNAYQQLSYTGATSQAFHMVGAKAGTGTFTNEFGKDVIVRYDEYIQAAKDLGLQLKETSLYEPNQAGVNEYSGVLVEITGDINDAFTSKLEKARSDLKYYQEQLEYETSSINEYYNTWLQTEWSYGQIDDTGLQQSVQNMLFNFDLSKLPKDVDKNNWDEVSEYFRRNILFEISNIKDDPIISNALSEVFSNAELTPDEKVNYLQQIQDYFGKNSAIAISIQPEIENTEDLQNQYNDAIANAEKKFGEDQSNFFKEHSINTSEEIERWNDIANACDTAAEAQQKYLNPENGNESGISNFLEVFDSTDFADSKEKLLELAAAGELSPETLESTEDYKELLTQTGLLAEEACRQINDYVNATGRLDSFGDKLDAISNAYKEFKENGFVDVDTINGIDESLKKLESFEDFSLTVGSSTTSIEEKQKAFDKLVSQYMMSSDVLHKLNNETKDYYITQLENIGVSNARAIVEERVNAELEAKDIIEKQNNLTMEEFVDKTYENQAALLAEAEASNSCRKYLAELQLAEIALNEDGLNVTGKIEQLAELATAYGLTGLKAQQMLQRQKEVDEYENRTGANTGFGYTEADWKRAEEDMRAAIRAQFATIDAEYNGDKDTRDSISKEAKDSAEVFDFIETKIERLETEISKLDTTATDTFASMTKRAKAYGDEIAKVTDEITLQNQAYDAYMNKANSIGLDEYWASQVRDGSLNIAEVKDEDLKEDINDYKTWYEKAQQSKNSIAELETKRIQLNLDNIQLDIDKKSDAYDKLEKRGDKINDRISAREVFGQSAKSSDYKKLNDNIGKQIKNLQSQNELITQQQSHLDKDSEAWAEYQSKIDDNNASIRQFTQSIMENAKAMAELNNARADRRVEKIDAKDELYEAKASNTGSYSKQNSLIDKEIGNISKRQQAYNQAVTDNESGLKSARKSLYNIKSTANNSKMLTKIRSYVSAGKEIPTDVITSAALLSPSLAEKCANYNAYLIEAETSKATAELYAETSKQDRADKATQKMDNIESYYQNRQSLYANRADQINSNISLVQAQGYDVSSQLYKDLIAEEKKNNASLISERDKLVKSLAVSVENGSIVKYSDGWYEMMGKIDGVTNSINESTSSLVEFNNQLRQLDWDNFAYLQEQIRDITEESDFMISQLSRRDLTSDDIGGLTSEGKAVNALHLSNYTTYTDQAKQYKKEISDINKELAKDPYNKELIEQKDNLTASYQDCINAAQEEKYAVIDLYTQGYEALKNKISELISEYGDLLDNQKDVYDYSNNLAEQTKKIGNLRKQLAAYANDLSEETRAKIQNISVSLEEAEKDLQETQYDKYISDTKDMLSDLQEDLADSIADIISSLADNFGTLTSEIKSSTTDAVATITDAMKGLGYTSSDDFKTILDGTDIVASTKTAISDTKTFQDKMLEYAEQLVNKPVDAKDLVNNESLSGSVSNAKDDYKAAKDEHEKNKTALDKAEKSYKAAQTAYKLMPSNMTNKALGYAMGEYNKAKLDYMSSKDNLDAERERYNVFKYLGEHLNETKREKSELSDVNKAFYDQYAKILSDKEINELAAMLKVDANGKKSGDLFQKLKELGINGFAIGSKSIPYDQLAFVAEHGDELHFNKSGQYMEVLGKGDMVFTNEMSENLWKLSQLNPATLMNGMKLTPVVPSGLQRNAGDVTVNFGDLVLPDVTNSQEFADSVKGVMQNAIRNDRKTQKMMQAVTIDRAIPGNNSLSVNRFR